MLMTLAADLKQRFEWALDVCLESYEVLPDGRSFVRSDRDEQAIEVFKRMSATVDAIPATLLASAEALRGSQPRVFEGRMKRDMRAVGASFMPTSAPNFSTR
jgi:hypothetical protein